MLINRISSRLSNKCLAQFARTTNSVLLNNSLCAKQQQRFLNLHEYQSMNLMQKYSIKTPQYLPATTPTEAEAAAYQLQSFSQSKPLDFVVKAQVLTGGRGLGYFKENGFKGGVHICTSPQEVKKLAEKMIGNTLITKQAADGKQCNTVLIAERFYIRKERYFAILLDRESSSPMVLASSVGGTSIEDIAHDNPNAIFKMKLDLNKKPTQQQILEICKGLGITDPKLIMNASPSIQGLLQMFMDTDSLLIEVNPLAETHDGRILVCDSKVNFDDNAEYRQAQIFALKDHSQMDPREILAEESNLNYVGLDGTIGCMVNGAGLAMATMDLIQLHGGRPANFLDVGGGADEKQVADALKILQNDSRVNCIFVNIFGGIMRCDIIANGLISASSKIGLTKPLVIRLEGTNRNEAKKLLFESGLKATVLFEEDFNEAAKKSVQISRINELANQASLKISLQ